MVNFAFMAKKIFGTTKNSLEWAILSQFLCIGHLFHFIFVNEIDFVLWNWNFQIFGAFPKMFGYSKYFLKCFFKNWIFQVLSTKSISLTKIKWKRCPIHRNWLKIAHFGEFLVVPKFLGKFLKYHNLEIPSSKSTFVS